MSFTRALAIRRVAVPRSIPRASMPIGAARQVRWDSAKSNDGDLGGPGGQEPVPPQSGASQSWPTLAAIAAVGVGVGAYLVHLKGKPKGTTTPGAGDFDKLAEKVTPGEIVGMNEVLDNIKKLGYSDCIIGGWEPTDLFRGHLLT